MPNPQARVVSRHTPNVPPMPRYVVLDCWVQDPGPNAWIATAYDTLAEAERDAEQKSGPTNRLRAVVVEIAEGGAS